MLCDNEDVEPRVIMSSDVMIYESCPPKLQARLGQTESTTVRMLAFPR